MDPHGLLAHLDPQRGIHIDGRWIGTDRSFVVHDPATLGIVAEVADAGPTEAVAAVDAAARALPAWSARRPRERADVLGRAFELLVARTDQLAALIVTENGKSHADARSEVAYAAEFLRWYAEEAVRGEGEYAIAPASGARTLVTHRPVGVAALVTPWNFPAAMVTRKIAPALAAGCTVVLKPAAETPLTAIAIVRILQEAGSPAGVVNLVPSTDAARVVTSWLKNGRVRKLSFTGSTEVGRDLLRQAADRVLNVSMELGGNAAFVVTADADVDAAVAGAMIAKFRGGGQACTAANRFYIHAAVAEEFMAKFGAAVQGLRVGPGSYPSTEIGPMISAQAVADLDALVESAVAAGATVDFRGDRPGRGWFYPPTVLAKVAPDSPILRQEIFGPIAPVVVWDDLEAMLAQVNDTESGLAAYLYADRLQDALKIAERIDAGLVGINRGIVSDPAAPFGGFKQSGLGREGARDGIREFQETQSYSVDWT